MWACERGSAQLCSVTNFLPHLREGLSLRVWRGRERARGEGVKEFLEIAFRGEDIYSSQVECVFVERKQQGTGNCLV